MKSFDYKIDKYKFRFFWKVIKELRKSKNKLICRIQIPKKMDGVHYWYKIRNPVVLTYNALLCLLIYISPPGLSNISGSNTSVVPILA